MVNSNDPIFVDSILKVVAKEDLNIQNDLDAPDTNHKTIEELLNNNEEDKK